MRKGALVLLVLIPFLSGCDLLKKASEIKITTNLSTDLPVVVTAPLTKSGAITGTTTTIDYTKTVDLRLDSNPDIEPYLSKIQSINLKGLVVTINGLSEGQTINSVTLAAEGVGTIFTQTDITMSNNSFTPAVDQAKFTDSSTKLLNDKKLTLTVSGAASGPMTFTVSCNFDTEVVAQVL